MYNKKAYMWRAHADPRKDAAWPDGTYGITDGIHPVSITRFPLIIFSPGAGLLSNMFVHR